MTSRQIASFITKLNTGKATKTIFKHKISANIYCAKVWCAINTKDVSPYNFFFIKNNTNFVGAVFDMYDDLHWYISPKYRGKGLLTKALRDVILPYVFEAKERDRQTITITKSEIGEVNYNASLKVAKSVGFKTLDSLNFILLPTDLNYEYNEKYNEYLGLSKVEVDKLKRELNNISKRLYQINAQIESGFGLDIEGYSDKTLLDAAQIVNLNKTVIQDIADDFSEIQN